jgi:hypothetical protein
MEQLGDNWNVFSGGEGSGVSQGTRRRRGVNERQYPLFGNEGPEEDVEAILHVRD